MAERTALQHFLRPVHEMLSDATITELCINRPHEVWLERHDGWQRHPAQWATHDWAMHVTMLLASASQQRFTSQHPLLSASLPTGERVQVIGPPATMPGIVAVSVRKDACRGSTLTELLKQGYARGCIPSDSPLAASTALGEAYRAQNWGEFLRSAVAGRQNILISGPTGSGKTTLTRALIAEIDEVERLITIEDAPELELAEGRNAVRLFYSKDGMGLSRLTARHLLEACLRMRPERILLAEIRGSEAYQFLRAVNSGHPGSITSIHASSAELAFEQLALLVKESDAGREMAGDEVRAFLKRVVDVVVHCDRVAGARRISEIWWRGASERVTEGS